MANSPTTGAAHSLICNSSLKVRIKSSGQKSCNKHFFNVGTQIQFGAHYPAQLYSHWANSNNIF